MMSGPFKPGMGEAVGSPCVSICVMDDVTGFCNGCFRTLDEIAGWVAFSNDDKRAVLACLADRRIQVTAMRPSEPGAP